MLGQNYCESVDNPFVYMQAGKFNYQGEEYYLKTCNYLISMFLNDSDELVVAPSTDYFYKWGGGIALPTNQVDADRFLKAHFLALKKMGFNSIRLMGCQVERRWDSDILTTSMYYKNHEAGDNPDPCVNDGEEGVRDWEILTDLESENGKEYYKQAMHVVLEAAEECGIKVIWVMGSERTYVDGNGNESIRSLLTPTGHTINQQFCNFLHDIAIEFRGNSTLIGYDLFNELLSYNGIEGCTTPYELSETVKSLVESIKFVDRNHFITVGHVSIRTFFILGVEPFKHCDVHSFHLYEGEYSDNHIQTNGSEINRQLYYFNKTIDFPWMIGEVGSSTHIPEQNPDEDEIAEKELEQRDFALSTLQKSLDCNSLGYSWWQLYDHQYDDKGKWGVLTADGGYEPVNLDDSGTNTVNIFGEFKKIVDFTGSGENGLSSSVFNIPLTQNECNFLPNAENDPYHYYIYPPIANNTERKHWKGKVLGNGQPLVDAVVKVSVMYPTTNLDDGSSLRDFFTFTKSDGTFELANKALCNAYGTTTEALEGHRDSEFNPQDGEVENFMKNDIGVISGKKMVIIPEEKITYADGSEHWLSTIKVPLIEQDGSCDKLLAVAIDIS
ncbi:MAG: PAS domain S-box protein, partial [Clostridia bacterium]|nr:PAS domain S-box protein [Clostridia bacterium]